MLVLFPLLQLLLLLHIVFKFFYILFLNSYLNFVAFFDFLLSLFTIQGMGHLPVLISDGKGELSRALEGRKASGLLSCITVLVARNPKFHIYHKNEDSYSAR